MTASNDKTLQPFGLWPSPITPAMVAHQLRLEDIQWDSDGHTLIWLEGHSSHGVLVASRKGEAWRDLTTELSVQGGIGYGGGEFTVSKGVLIFAERNGRLYRRSLGQDSPRPITPPFGSSASPLLSPDGRWVVYVFSDGDTDLLGMVDAEGRDWPYQLARGADFYMQPAWHPSGKYLAWIEWNHPNMPWNGTRLKLGRLAGKAPRLVEESLIAGDDHTPVSQPMFSPDGRWLSYIASNGEWDRLVIMDMQNKKRRILIEGDHYMLSQPAWIQGMRFYGWSHTCQRIFYIRNYAGFASLWAAELENDRSKQIDVAPYTWITQLSVSPVEDQLAFIASSPSIPERIIRWDGKCLHTICYSETEGSPPEALPTAQPITWSTPNGTTVHGLYYAPINLEYTGSGSPPAIIELHGGPTSQRSANYSADRAFFTTRGYGYLEVNYRGSSGYGRRYQDLLHENWGKVDVEDAVGGAQALVDQGLAVSDRLAILGGSAGGYTVLNTLIRHPGKFKAGICSYAVSNLLDLAMETQKFEKHYCDSLIGSLPEAASRYHDLSPIYHAEGIQEPLAIFQGMDDKVVMPSQSEAIVKVLKQNGVPYLYRIYEGEGHGFRKSETIIDYLEQTERFLRKFVLFSA